MEPVGESDKEDTEGMGDGKKRKEIIGSGMQEADGHVGEEGNGLGMEEADGHAGEEGDGLGMEEVKPRVEERKFGGDVSNSGVEELQDSRGEGGVTALWGRVRRLEDELQQLRTLHGEQIDALRRLMEQSRPVTTRTDVSSLSRVNGVQSRVHPTLSPLYGSDEDDEDYNPEGEVGMWTEEHSGEEQEPDSSILIEPLGREGGSSLPLFLHDSEESVSLPDGEDIIVSSSSSAVRPPSHARVSRDFIDLTSDSSSPFKKKRKTESADDGAQPELQEDKIFFLCDGMSFEELAERVATPAAAGDGSALSDPSTTVPLQSAESSRSVGSSSQPLAPTAPAPQPRTYIFDSIMPNLQQEGFCVALDLKLIVQRAFNIPVGHMRILCTGASPPWQGDSPGVDGRVEEGERSRKRPRGHLRPLLSQPFVHGKRIGSVTLYCCLIPPAHSLISQQPAHLFHCSARRGGEPAPGNQCSGAAAQAEGAGSADTSLLERSQNSCGGGH